MLDNAKGNADQSGAPTRLDVPAQAPPAAARIAWIDKARGIGIVLVVIGHAVGGLIDAHRTPANGAFQLIFGTIYVFHMPLFFVLSAYFVPARLRRSPAQFARGWWRGLIWPALLWSLVLILVVTTADAGALNHQKPAVLNSILRLPFAPVGPFWFIYALLVLHVVTTLIELGGFGALATVVLVILGALRELPIGDPLVHVIFVYAPWYAAGLALGRWQGGTLPLLRTGWLAKLVILAAVAGLFVLTGPASLSEWSTQMLGGTTAISRMVWTARFLFLAIAAVVATIICADWLHGRAGMLASYVGQRSMVIYVMHVIVVAATRTIMVHLHANNPWTLAICETALGVTAPLAVFAVASRLGISSWLGLGRPITKSKLVS